MIIPSQRLKDGVLELKNLLILLLIIIIVVIALGTIFILLSKEKKKAPAAGPKAASVESLIERVKDKKSSKSTLADAAKELEANHLKIDNKKLQVVFLFYLAKNPNSDSKLILELEKKLKAANPNHAKELERYMKEGIDSRQG